MTLVQVLVKILKNVYSSDKMEFCGGANHYAENYFKRIGEKIFRLVIRINDGLNVHLTNVLDADLKITWLLNVLNHLKITSNYKVISVSMKGLIVHCKKNGRTVIMIMIKIYIYLYHEFLIMMKVIVEILVIVRNWQIGFLIHEERVIWFRGFEFYPSLIKIYG